MDREAVYSSVQRLGVVAWSALGALGILWVGILVGSKIAIIFPPLVLGIAIIYLLNPFVSWLERRQVPRFLGSGSRLCPPRRSVQHRCVLHRAHPGRAGAGPGRSLPRAG